MSLVAVILSLKYTTLHVAEKEFTYVATIFTKLGQHVELTRRIGHNCFSSSCINIKNNKHFDTGCPAQKAIDARSSRISKIFLQCYPYLLEDSYGHASIDNAPLTKKTENFILSRIIGI